MLFQLHKAGTLGREQHLAAEFNGCGRVVALHAGDQRALHTFQLLGAVLENLFDHAGQRLHQPIGQQDAEERPHQGGRDHAAQHGRRLAHGAHGVHHPQHRGHDTEGGQRPSQTLQGRNRAVGFLVVGFDFVLHQRLNFVRIEIAGDHHPQVVGDEFHQMVVGQDVRVLLEQRRFVGLFHVRLDGHQAFLAGLLQQVVQQGQQAHEPGFGVLGAFDGQRNGSCCGLQHLGLIAHDEGAKRPATNGGHFKRQCLAQHGHVATVQSVDAEDAAEGHEVTDEDKHGEDSVSQQAELRGKKRRKNAHLRRLGRILSRETWLG